MIHPFKSQSLFCGYFIISWSEHTPNMDSSQVEYYCNTDAAEVDEYHNICVAELEEYQNYLDSLAMEALQEEFTTQRVHEHREQIHK